MKILVTGSNGQLGNEIAQLAPSYSDSNFTFIDLADLDLTNSIDVQNYFKNNSFDLLINCAAYTAVDKAQEDINLATKVNKDVPELLAKMSVEHNFSIVHISTDFVFSGDTNTPYVETDQTSPISVYGSTKRDGELAILNNAKSAIIIRTSWLYSNYGANFVKNITKLAIERDELNIIADQLGTPTHAKDLASAILVAAHSDMFESACEGLEIFHYSNHGMTSWYHFTKEITAIQDIVCNISPIPTSAYPTPATRPAYSVMNCSKIEDWFNIEIPYWRDSLITMLKGEAL